MSEPGGEPLSVRVEAPGDAVWAAAEEVAEVWGAAFDRHRETASVDLPVKAGLRRGWVKGDFEIRSEGSASHLLLNLTEETYRLAPREIVVLLFGALGGLFLVIVPFYPQLFDLIPFAGILLLLAWFLVVAQLRHKSARDYLEEVRDLAQEPQTESAQTPEPDRG